MKILILSTYEKAGGAAIAAARLCSALNKSGVEARMVCRRNLKWWRGKPQSWTSIFERGIIWAISILCRGKAGKSPLWAADIALLGQDITKTREYREADVIHLHWVCQGFISLGAIEGFIRDGKKVVWTMHDAWNAMGAYHLRIHQRDDMLERMTWKRKQRLYQGGDITFVTCSQWLRDEALASDLMKTQEVVAIPNPIEIPSQPSSEVGSATSSDFSLRKDGKKRVLFVAQNVNNEMKGIRYLDEAAKMLPDVEIVALGRDIPYIKDAKKMIDLYRSVDAFVLPSLSENLPNTIMEAMACGTPCVAFRVGGIPEMIDHKINGYLARYKDSADLADGIRYVLSEENHERLAEASRKKIVECYSEEVVAARYIEIYKA